MKKQLLVIIACIAIAGCATRQAVITHNPDGTSATNEVYLPHPAVEKAAQIGAAVTPLIPAPFGSAAELALGLFLTGYAGYVKIKNNQLKAETDKKTGVNATLIEAIESLGTSAAPIKEKITEVAVKNGNADDVHAAVLEHV
jgi:hypothetical protein